MADDGIIDIEFRSGFDIGWNESPIPWFSPFISHGMPLVENALDHLLACLI